MRVLTKRLRLKSRGFRYKVALYLSYLHIKFDDEIKENPFEGHAYFPIRLRLKLNWRLGLALFAVRFRSYWDSWHIYGNQRTCDKQRYKPIRTTERWFADTQNVYWLSSALSINIYVAYE